MTIYLYEFKLAGPAQAFRKEVAALKADFTRLQCSLSHCNVFTVDSVSVCSRVAL